jgi:UDP-glucose 4-epimerase
MKKILVTGGAGYIGSHTVAELVSSGFMPVIVDDFSNSDARVLDGLREILGYDVPLYKLDCSDSGLLREVFIKEKPAGVIHFAAFKAVGESVADPMRYYSNNLGSLMSLIEVMHEFGCNTLVFSSSCTVYGQPESNPVTESTPRLPANSPYGRTKQMCEDIIMDYCVSNPSFRATLLRYFNPIGAHPSGLIGELPYGVPNNLVPFLTQAAAGIREKLVVFGNDYATPDGSCIRDYIHVMDLAAAHVSALKYITKIAPGCSVFNLGQGKGNSVLELIRTFTEVTGVMVPYEMGARRPGDVEQIWADASKSSALLNWSAKRTLADALRDAWRWQNALSTERFCVKSK